MMRTKINLAVQALQRRQFLAAGLGGLSCACPARGREAQRLAQEKGLCIVRAMVVMTITRIGDARPTRQLSDLMNWDAQFFGDGKRIAYRANQLDIKENLIVRSYEDAVITSRPYPREASKMAFSNDLTKLVFWRSATGTSDVPEVYLAARNEETLLLRLPLDRKRRASVRPRLSWHPNGIHVYIEHEQRICRLDTETGAFVAMMPGSCPEVSLCGQMLAYVDSASFLRLVYIERGAELPVSGTQRVFGGVRWSPDSEFLILAKYPDILPWESGIWGFQVKSGAAFQIKAYDEHESGCDEYGWCLA